MMSSICSGDVSSEGEDRVQFIEGHITPLLCRPDQTLDGGIGQVEDGRILAFGRCFLGFGLLGSGLGLGVFGLRFAHLGSAMRIQILACGGGLPPALSVNRFGVKAARR